MSGSYPSPLVGTPGPADASNLAADTAWTQALVGVEAAARAAADSANAAAITGETSRATAAEAAISTVANAAIPTAQRGVANGIATLDGNTTLSLTQIPSGLRSGLTPVAGWNAATNTPTLVNSVGTSGNFYIVTTSGNTNLNGSTGWLVGDWALFSGGVWTRVALSSGFGTLVVQNADAVAITGGSATGMTKLGLSNADASQPMLTPDISYALRDTAGNVVLYVDLAGTLNASSVVLSSATIAALTVTQAPNFAGATIGTDTIQTAAGILPDLTHTFRDTSGNVIAGFAADGSFHASGLNVANTAIIDGQAVGGASAPSDALDVRNYGALGDAVESFCYATTTKSGNTLTIFNFSGTLTLVQTTTTIATLTIVGAIESGVAFQPASAGQQLYLVVGGYTLQAAIAQYIDGQTVLLTASGITPQTSVSGVLTWPCFQTFNVGEYLVFDGMGQNAVWLSALTVKTPDPTLPYGQQAFIAQIASVVSPTQITIAGTFPFAFTAAPARLRWGANDGNAVALAGQAAFSGNKRKLYFFGNGNLYLMLGMVGGMAERIGYIATVGTDAGAALNGCIWQGDNASTFACDDSGLPLPNTAVQVGSDASKLTDRTLHGRASFPRCNQLTTINLFVTGDSQSNYNPQNQAAAWMQAHKFVEEFKRANPRKTVNVYLMGVGGQTFSSLADPANVVNDASASTDGWTVPRPISGTKSLVSFMLNANQTASGSPILPDCVAIFCNGGNDVQNMDGASMQYLINSIRAVSHGDGFGPADIILQTDHANTVIPVSSSGNTGGVTVPDSLEGNWWCEYSSTLISSTAIAAGYGCVDLAGLVNRAVWGYDEMHRAMRSVPSFTATGSPTAPIQLPYRCRDFTLRFTLPGASDAAVWAAMKELDFQISLNAGGKLLMRLGANGNLWVGVSVWGGLVNTTCTIANGGTSLTVGAPTTFTGQTFTQKSTWPQLYTPAANFSSGQVGQCIVLPTGDKRLSVYQLQRNFVAGYLDANNVTLQDNVFNSADIVGVTGASFAIGGVQFMPADSNSQPDVVIFYPDGTIFNTQVAAGGYVSATQATLASAAPQALTAQSVPVFIGRMMPRWFDTGFNLSGISTTGTFEIDISRRSLIIGYQASTRTHPMTILDMPIERFGGQFYPVLTPSASQSVQVNDAYIDADKPFLPSATAWELRGIPDANSDYFLGGVGGHPSSRLRTDVVDPFYSAQNLSTY